MVIEISYCREDDEIPEHYSYEYSIDSAIKTLEELKEIIDIEDMEE